MTVLNSGIAYAVTAQLLWGLFPLYWSFLSHVHSFEVLLHRNIWCVCFLAPFIFSSAPRVGVLKRLLGSRRLLKIHLASGGLIALNWGVYIWAVAQHRIVDASLGYFLSPLLSVGLGYLLFGEALVVKQKIALALASLAVALLVVMAQQGPWLGLVLAMSFAGYGALRKIAGIDAVVGLFFETLLFLPLSVGVLMVSNYLQWFDSLSHSNSDMMLLVTGGVVTGVPLLLFGHGARSLPLSLSGMLVYITPMMQFSMGYWFFNEEVEPMMWGAFTIIWLALLIFSSAYQKAH